MTRRIILALFFTMGAVIAGYSQEAKPRCDTSNFGTALARISHPPLEAIKKVPPKYPEIAKAAHISGDVVVQTVVDRKGDVARAYAEEGHPRLLGVLRKLIVPDALVQNYAPSVQDFQLLHTSRRGRSRARCGRTGTAGTR